MKIIIIFGLILVVLVFTIACKPVDTSEAVTVIEEVTSSEETDIDDSLDELEELESLMDEMDQEINLDDLDSSLE